MDLVWDRLEKILTFDFLFEAFAHCGKIIGLVDDDIIVIEAENEDLLESLIDECLFKLREYIANIWRC